jgi:phage terminase large subunit-like protein
MPYSDDHAERVIQFCETYGVHSKGIYAGQPLKLLPFQSDDIIRPLFGTLNGKGYRQYREAYISLAAKNGKSFLTSALALYMLLGDGEAGAEIYLAACDRQQAGIVFANVAHFVRSSDELSSLCNVVDSSKRIVFKDRVLRVLSSEADSAMGYNASAVVADELAFWKSRELYDALRSRMRFRKQPLFISITTASKDLFGVAHELYEHAKHVDAGIADDPTFFSYIRECPADADISDPENWKLANPALGTDEEIAAGQALLSMDDMRAEYNKAVQIPSQMSSFRTLYLNQWVSQASEDKLFVLAQWDACESEAAPADGSLCYGGLDLSTTTDLTALAFAFPQPDGSIIDRVQFFMPADNVALREQQDRVPYSQWVRNGLITATPGNVVDYGFVLAAIKAASLKYRIGEIALDPYGAALISQQIQDLGLTPIKFGQSAGWMNAPTKELQRLVLAQQIKQDGNKVLRWNVECHVAETDAENQIKIVKVDRRRNFKRIDGLVASVMAVDRAMRQTPISAALTGPSVYERRGILVL